jgi:hypothetical protein
MAFKEVLKAGWNVPPLQVQQPANLPGHIFRDIARPSLVGIEAKKTDRI